MSPLYNHIKTWVFDLDNTLYDAHSHTYPDMYRLIIKFLVNFLNITEEEAKAWRKDSCGGDTTLQALRTEFDLDTQGFLDFFHASDVSHVPVCLITQEKLAALSGRKVIFTNSIQSWADKMLAQLGISDHFDDCFTVEDTQDFQQKPQADIYPHFLEKMKIDPKTACFFEDMVENLKPAYDIGMTTVLIHPKCHDADVPYVHDKAKTMADWLNKNIGEKV